MLPSILNAGRGEGIVKAAEIFLLGTRENGVRFRQKALIQDDGGGRARQKRKNEWNQLGLVSQAAEPRLALAELNLACASEAHIIRYRFQRWFKRPFLG